MATQQGARDVLLKAESAVADTICSTSGGISAGQAVLAAADASREGRRASVVLAPGELLGAVSAIHDAARARAPIVVHVVVDERRSGEPTAGHDELAPVLDAGAGVLVSWSVEDTLDLSLAARRAAEDSETPFLIFTDGGGEPMSLPGSGLVSKFLGGARAARPAASAQDATAAKRAERSFASRVPFALAGAMRELGELTGRPISPVERWETADAEEIVVAVGHAFVAARRVAGALRREGRKVGVVGLRALRPFFAIEAVKAVSRARSVAVLEPLDVALAPSGPVAASLKGAFADALTWAPGFPGVGRIPPIVSAVFATLDGGVGDAEVRAALAELATGDRSRRVLVFGSDGDA